MYEYNPERHGNPLAEYSFKKFYFIIHEGKIMIFERHNPSDSPRTKKSRNEG